MSNYMYYQLILSVIIGGVHSQDVNVINCEAGFYFDTAVCLPCPQNCKFCETSLSCNTCKPGYFGKLCSDMCEQNCYQSMCNKTSGLCLHCRKGFYFDNSGMCVRCPDNCRDCDSKANCFECNSGYKGKTCDEVCTNCKHGTECKQNNGYCIIACTDGHCGALCDTLCDSKCRACNRLNSKQCIGCTVESYGTNCTDKCSDRCYHRICNANDGFCTNGCENGYWGNKCENICSKDCKDKFCNRENGSCSYGNLYDHTGKECLCQKNSNCDRNGVCKNCTIRFGEFCEVMYE